MTVAKFAKISYQFIKCMLNGPIKKVLALTNTCSSFSNVQSKTAQG